MAWQEDGPWKLFDELAPGHASTLVDVFQELCLDDRTLALSSLGMVITFVRAVAANPAISTECMGARLLTVSCKREKEGRSSKVKCSIAQDALNREDFAKAVDEELRNISMEIGRQELEALERDGDQDEEAKAHKKFTIESWIALFKGGKVFNKSVLTLWDEVKQGATESEEESAGLMRSAWLPQFALEPIDQQILQSFLDAENVDFSSVEWAMDEQDFYDQVEHPKMSSPGLDGVHYKLWIADPRGKFILWRVYKKICRDGTAPSQVQPLPLGVPGKGLGQVLA